MTKYQITEELISDKEGEKDGKEKNFTSVYNDLYMVNRILLLECFFWMGKTMVPSSTVSYNFFNC